MTGPSSQARIFDRGFRRYDGPRTGVGGSLRTLVKQSLRHALGIGRPARFKIIPLAVVVMAYLPAAVFVGLAALIKVGAEEFLPTYAGYYGFVAATIYLLAGFVSPELLCSDRRYGFLGVYLASPLTRPTYLLGKVIAVFLLLLLVTLGPPLLMLIAFTLQNMGPDGFGEWLRVFGRIVASSVVMGFLYTAISLAVSATTDRVTVATATILAIIPGSGVVSDRMVLDAGLAPELRLFNLLFLPRALIFRIHGETGGWPEAENSTLSLWLVFLLWTGVSLAWVYLRYQRMLVRR